MDEATLDDELAQIRAAARHAVTEFGPLSDVEFGYDRASLAWVEGFVDRMRHVFDAEESEGFVVVVGAFLGECMIAGGNARWEFAPEQNAWCVRMANGAKAFPFTKVTKLWRDGLVGGESLVSFYDIGLKYLATDRLRQAAHPDGRD